MLRQHLQRAIVLAVLCCGASAARADDARAPSGPSSQTGGRSDILEVAEETCLTRENVGERLTPLLAATELPDGLRISLRVDADGKATFVVSVGSENVGVRSFETLGLTCENKLKVVSFAIAVAIEGIVESRAAKQRETQPAVRPTPASKPTPTPMPTLTPKRRGPSWTVGVGDGLFATSLGASAAVMVDGGMDISNYGFRISLLQTLGSTVEVAPGAVRYALTLGRAHACANVVRIGTVVGRGCALAGVGSFDARGTGYYSGGEGRSGWVDAGVAAEASFNLSRRWALRASVAPFGILRGPTLRVTDARTGRVVASSDVPRIGVLFSLEMAFRLGE